MKLRPRFAVKPRPRSITLFVSDDTVSIARGGTQQITLRIARENYLLPVPISLLPTLPTGVTLVIDTPVLTGDVLETIAEFTAAADAPAVSVFPVQFLADGTDGVADAIVSGNIEVTVPVVPSIAASLNVSSLSLTQSGSAATARVTLQRIDGHAADVTVTVAGTPANVTVAKSHDPLSGGQLICDVQFTPGANANVGTNQPVTITLDSAGVSSVVLDLAITVAASSGTYVPLISDDFQSYADTAAFRAAVAAKTLYTSSTNAPTMMEIDTTVLFNGRKTLKQNWPAGNIYSRFKAYNANTGQISAATDTFIGTHPFVTGDLVIFDQDYQGTPPAPLTQLGQYYVIRVDGSNLKLATSLANANNGIAIDLTTGGAGTRPSLSIVTNASEVGAGTGYPSLMANFPGAPRSNLWGRKIQRWTPPFRTQTTPANVQFTGGNRFSSSSASLKEFGFIMASGEAYGRCIGINAGVGYQREWNVNSYTNGGPSGGFINVSGQSRNLVTSGEWDSGEWYEYLQHTLELNAQQVRYRHWWRKVGDPWILQFDDTYTAVAPKFIPNFSAFCLNLNFNQYRDPDSARSNNIAEWEVVDGSVYPDPYGLGAGI